MARQILLDQIFSWNMILVCAGLGEQDLLRILGQLLCEKSDIKEVDEVHVQTIPNSIHPIPRADVQKAKVYTKTKTNLQSGSPL